MTKKKVRLLIVAGIVVIHLKVDAVLFAFKILADFYQITQL